VLVLLVNNAQVYLPQQWWCEKNTCFGSCVSINAITYSWANYRRNCLTCSYSPQLPYSSFVHVIGATAWRSGNALVSIIELTLHLNRLLMTYCCRSMSQVRKLSIASKNVNAMAFTFLLISFSRSAKSTRVYQLRHIIYLAADYRKWWRHKLGHP